jgi:nucleoside-diphosphate-sugar epimerase
MLHIGLTRRAFDMSLRILVTGANGFVGRCVCGELSRRGYAVRAAVRGEDRGRGLADEIVAVGDLGPGTDWSRAVTDIDAIIHLAARVHVMKETAADPLHAFRAANVRATESLAQAAADRGVKRFVYVSSIKVNGEETAGQPFTPDNPARPCDPYGVSKWEGEQVLRRVADATHLEVTVVRPPLVYGPGVGGNFLRLLKLVQRGIPLPFGAIDNHRSMIYNRNLASALIVCALHPNASGKTYLVADGEDLSTRELVRRLATALGQPARLLPVPPRMLRLAGALIGADAEVDRLIGSLRVDSTPIRTELAWSPPYAIADALEETAKWFRGRRVKPIFVT